MSIIAVFAMSGTRDTAAAITIAIAMPGQVA